MDPIPAGHQRERGGCHCVRQGGPHLARRYAIALSRQGQVGNGRSHRVA